MQLRIQIALATVLFAGVAFAAPDDTLIVNNVDPTGGGVANLQGDEYQIAYIANLLNGDSYVNLTNAGTRGGYEFGTTLAGARPGGICVNVYTFDPSEELIACCSCYVSPDGLRSLSAKQDLVSNTLTPGVPTSIVVKLVATTPVDGKTSCSASANTVIGTAITPAQVNATVISLEPGMRAWATSLHQNSTTGAFEITENEFLNARLSVSEYAKLTTFCGFIAANGSNFGVCKSCRLGGLGGAIQ